MLIDRTKVVKINAKTLSLVLKVSDQFCALLKDSEGHPIKDYEGYVPNFMPGEHYGDYVELDIDIDTGEIVNWEVPTKEQIEAFVDG